MKHFEESSINKFSLYLTIKTKYLILRIKAAILLMQKRFVYMCKDVCKLQIYAICVNIKIAMFCVF